MNQDPGSQLVMILFTVMHSQKQKTKLILLNPDPQVYSFLLYCMTKNMKPTYSTSAYPSTMVVSRRKNLHNFFDLWVLLAAFCSEYHLLMTKRQIMVIQT